MTTFLWGENQDSIKNFVLEGMTQLDGFPPDSAALGWVRPADGGACLELVGGVVLVPRGGAFDAELSISLDPDCLVTRRQLRQLFHIAFVDMGLVRLTCLVSKRNKQARRFMSRLGFIHEGTKVKGYDGVNNALVYGMTRDRCKWLKGGADG